MPDGQRNEALLLEIDQTHHQTDHCQRQAKYNSRQRGTRKVGKGSAGEWVSVCAEMTREIVYSRAASNPNEPKHKPMPASRVPTPG
jgi:hypothetical protein